MKSFLGIETKAFMSFFAKEVKKIQPFIFEKFLNFKEYKRKYFPVSKAESKFSPFK